MRRDAKRMGGLKERQGRDGGKGKGDRGNGRDGCEREGKGGRGEGRREVIVPKLKFVAPTLHERRESTRFTSDLDHPFRKSWIHP